MSQSSRSDPYLYRIVRFERLVQMLKGNELHFARPSSWEDPYEGIQAHPLSPSLFAQCWCREGVSDAMWRIYSPDKLGVRIRTKKSHLQSALNLGADTDVIGFRIANVKYVNELEYLGRLAAVRANLATKVTFTRVVAPLFLKRLAFKHEAEVRVAVFSEGATHKSNPDGIKIKVDARDLINSVLVDPRAPDEFVAAYDLFLRKQLKSPGRVRKSSLYRLAEPREV